MTHHHNSELCNCGIEQNLEQSDNDLLKKALGPKMVSCRICKGDHWTTKCPFKDSVKVADLDDAKGMPVPVVHLWY